MENYKLFSNWLDQILEQDIPKGINAFNFNLYEASGETYDIQLIGSDEFDENDSDWACTDYFSTEEDICSIKRSDDIQHWEQGLNYITMLVERYLKEGKFANSLKSASAIGIGFVDGDINILFRA
ncbi:hypothetical protein [Brevibacillus centrosporus]|uniref:hypothetical protein n=1 Tax=Brevibacillus centrosporus TaxID=54910 RepID=UPI003804D823